MCAAFNGTRTLTSADLGPWREFVRYQTNIRKFLKPNPGENFEAQLAHKFLDYLDRHHGAYVSRRDMFRDTHAYNKGPSTAERALSILHANGEVEITKAGKKVLVRRLLSDEEPITVTEEVPS